MGVFDNVPSNFFHCARKSIHVVFERPERLIFSQMSPKATTKSVSFYTCLMSLDGRPTSSLHSPHK